MKKTILAGLSLFLLTASGVNANSLEFQNAYSWARENGITTMNTIEGARMNDGLTRAEMAKMISNYAILISKTAESNEKCIFLDVSEDLDYKYDNGIKLSCQFGLMGQGINKFRPNDPVTRAEFGTVLSRLLYGNTYEGGDPYYTRHLQALQNNGIMSNISNPYMAEVRGYVMIMMQRASGKEVESGNEDKKGESNGKTTYANHLISTKVTNVVDGDTITVKLDGKSTSVRLIGIDTPENTAKRYGYPECYGAESKEYLTKLLDGKDIYLEYDESQGMYDSYDRILAYVFLGSENINKKIITDGYGWEYTYDKPYKYQSDFKEAQKLAENNNLGLWNTCNGERIPLKSNDGNIATISTGDIKGNINNKGEKIYHVPGCSHYEKTVITESKGERWFSTRQEAEQAGWRACIN